MYITYNINWSEEGQPLFQLLEQASVMATNPFMVLEILH